MLALLALSSAALADTDCARQDRSAWMPESQFREQMKRQGVQITKFRITPGNCYEIYGFDREGRKLEIYYDPVDVQPVEDVASAQLALPRHP
ncbi:PepSY domain-containing protein [Ectopseudomonas oleovorans]|uniref:PepSY domain-containing protein n=2 Tax=Ectopseudomonas oleovorans TaxID=301 RepID=A0A427HCW7_ECTOL|nr:PepSY domain-containing protein [Pseudomonas oleovorans]